MARERGREGWEFAEKLFAALCLTSRGSGGGGGGGGECLCCLRVMVGAHDVVVVEGG